MRQNAYRKAAGPGIQSSENPRAAGVAQAAGFNLLAQHGGREVARGVACCRIDWPKDVPPLVEPHEHALAGIFTSAERPPAFLGSRPADVS